MRECKVLAGHDAVAAGDQPGRQASPAEPSSAAQQAAEPKLLVFTDSNRGQEQLCQIEAALKGVWPGLLSVNGFEAFSSLSQEQISPLYFHAGVLPSLASCWARMSSTGSFVELLEQVEADQAVEQSQDFLKKAAKTVSAAFWLTSSSLQNGGPCVIQYEPFDPACNTFGSSADFLHVKAEQEWRVQLQARLTNTPQRLVILGTAEEDAAIALPLLLEDLAPEQALELEQLVARDRLGHTKWQQACFVAVLLCSPQDVSRLETAVQHKKAELTVILHIECRFEGHPSLTVDVRLDAQAETMVSGTIVPQQKAGPPQPVTRMLSHYV